MKNPDYESQMRARKTAQKINRESFGISPRVVVPKQPNKYVPHYGAKEAAKYAARGKL